MIKPCNPYITMKALILSFPHNYIRVAGFVNAICTFNNSKKGAPILGGVEYAIYGVLYKFITNTHTLL